MSLSDELIIEANAYNAFAAKISQTQLISVIGF
jgi:hypothetical protein